MTRQPNSAPLPLEAVKVAHLSAPGHGDVTYVVLTPPTAATSSDKRSERRWRTHLRSGKIVDARVRIVSESQIRDRSAHGLRLRLATPTALPRRIRFVDDVGKRLFEATVVWQRGREIGVSLLSEVEPHGLTRAERFRLGLQAGDRC